jgi:hypothetical protein
MDTNTAIILIVIIFALIVIAGFLVFRQKGEVEINTPFGKLRFGGSNEPAQSGSGRAESKATNLKAGHGNVKVTQTGPGTKEVDQVEAGDSIDISQTRDEQTPPTAAPKA